MAEGAVSYARQREARGRVLFAPKRWARLKHRFNLSNRQLQICKLLCGGYTTEAIAAELGITSNTVRMHLKGVFERVGARTRVMVVVNLVLADRGMG